MPEDYATIQQAIDNVDAGNRTILVNATAYNATETVVVDESNITIRSINGRAVVKADVQNDHVFNITGQTNVTLEGFTIRDAKGTSKSVAGIFIDNASGCNISNNLVRNITATSGYDAWGIYLRSSNNNTFGSSTTISDINASDGGSGIHLWSSSNNIFSSSINVSCVNAHWAYGIWLGGNSNNNTFGSSTSISDVTAGTTACGMYVDKPSFGNEFHNATITDVNSASHAYGIHLDISEGNSYTETTISNVTSTGANAYGILLDYTDDSSFTNTAISDVQGDADAYGIRLYYSNSNTFDPTIIENVTAVDENAYGIYLLDSNSTNFTDTTVANVTAGASGWEAYGIYLESSNNNAFDPTVIYNVDGTPGSFGVGLNSSDYNEFFDCTITDLTGGGGIFGVHMDAGSDNNIISRGKISSNIKYGVYMRNCMWNSILDSEIADSDYGIYIYDKWCSHTISGNTIYGNEFGIYLLDTWDNRIVDNEIRDNDHGVWVASTADGSCNNTIIRNMIVNNSGHTGVHLGDGSCGNKAYDNCFIDNTPQARDDGSNNDWDGNYWSDYAVEGGTYSILGTAGSKDHNTLGVCPLQPQPAPPPKVPSLNHWGVIAMTVLFAGLLVWTVRRRRVAS